MCIRSSVRDDGQSGDTAQARPAKLVVPRTAESRHDEFPPVCDPGLVHYSADIEHEASNGADPEPSKFSGRMPHETERCGFMVA